jgi:hypothetical protein
MRPIVAAAFVVGLVANAHAQPSEPERLYHDGQRAYDQGRFEDAVAAWQRSYELSKLPALQFNLGQAYRKRAWAGDCTRASDAYTRFVALEPRSPKRAQAEGFVRELAACAARETATPAPAQPAPHVVPAEPRRATPKARYAGYAGLATGGVLLAIGGYYGVRASSLADEVTKACARGCNFVDVAAKDAEGRSATRKQYVFYGLGAGAAIAGGVLYWMSTHERGPRGLAIAPIADGGAVAAWTRSW